MRPPALLALTPGDVQAGGEPALLARVARAAEAGLRGVLVRESALTDVEFLRLARAVRELLGEDGWLGISDRAHLAPAADANAIHLGFRSLRPDELPPALSEGRGVGLSTHAGDAAPDPELVTYAFHGPLRETPSKLGVVPVVGVEGLTAFCTASDVSVWALGGVRPEDVASAVQAGAAGVAVLAGILGARDPAVACEAYLSAVGGGARP